jgi:hypothetical protein
MKYFAILAASSAFVAPFMSDVCETVLIKSGDGNVRVNKADYEADQAEGGAKSMTLASKADQADAPQSTETVGTQSAPAIPVPPAPSAPGFDPRFASGIDPNASRPVAVASAVGETTLGVVERGTGTKKRFHVVTVADGKDYVGDRIEPAGYTSAPLAWDAVRAVIAPVGIMPTS